MISNLELVADEKSILAEGPCWDEQNKILYWIDILGNKIYSYNPESGKTTSINVGQNIGCIALVENGGIIAALQSGFYFIDFNTGIQKPIIDPEAHLPLNRFNDGKCDCKGRFWAGTMSTEENEGKGKSEPAGSLYCLNNDMTVRKVLDNIKISNGITWSIDNKTMYFIDSPTRNITAFDFDEMAGEIGNRHIAVVIPEGEGIPDGMTIDEEGMLWVAHWGGYKVSRWNPNTGKRLQEVNIPVCNVTSCAFGGEKLDELFITTSKIEVNDEEVIKQPHAGGVFKIKTGVRGLAMFKFNYDHCPPHNHIPI